MSVGKIRIGRNVYLGTNARLFGNIQIGDGTIIGDNVTIGHPTDKDLKNLRRVIMHQKEMPIEEIVHGYTRIGKESTIRSGSVIYTDTLIGDRLDCGHNVFIQWGTKIGNNCKIMENSRIYSEAVVGDNVRFNGFGCARCKIGSNVSMLGYLVHRYDIPKGGLIEESPHVEDMAVVGMLAIVVGGVTVRKGAYVGAGTVVTHDVEPFSIVVGERERVIGKRDPTAVAKIFNPA